MLAAIAILKILADLIVLTGKMNPFINLLINIIQFIIRAISTIIDLLDARGKQNEKVNATSNFTTEKCNSGA